MQLMSGADVSMHSLKPRKDILKLVISVVNYNAYA